MLEEVAAYGVVVVAIAHLGRGLFAATLMPALARLWPNLPRSRPLAATNGGERQANARPCNGCCGCASRRQQPQSQVLSIRRKGTADR
ncbi:hypothetical protein [Accumulibacter sp.]|uniref:hypothetical protein n=1 Tax=Accumulibacter sp. TaxID=2053492 RepID=UPI0025FC03DC|nr:hypothetical protein [Accumulibacter sp.]MCM8635079.1 hypothetical protein [Accumulibacter sp.]